MTNQFSAQLKQLKQNNVLIVILILLFVSIVIWTGVSIISSTTTSQLPANIIKLAAPLNPSINRQVLDKIATKHIFTKEELKSFAIYRLILDKRTNSERVITIDMDETVFSQPIPNTPTPSPTSSIIPQLKENQEPSPTPSSASEIKESQNE